jgi:hypothetical protein
VESAPAAKIEDGERPISELCGGDANGQYRIYRLLGCKPAIIEGQSGLEGDNVR